MRREHIKYDSLVALVHGITRVEDLKRPLKVIFDGEEGVDAGGVRKEFFQLIMSRLHFLNTSYGMFNENPESHLLWFNANATEQEDLDNFELIGTIVGLAIYNGVLLDFPFPSILCKKLKGHEADLGDLMQLQPDLARGLASLLSFPGDVESTFQTTFQVTFEDIFGERKTVDLRVGGADIMVNNDNRGEYVRLYVRHILTNSIARQYDSFAKGFLKVCGGIALNLFSAAELELLIYGNPALDFEDLARGARYEDGFESTSTTIGYFWTVLGEFNDEDKRNFLKFATGSDRAPIDGLSQLGLIISKNTDEDDRLPSAHTCFNHVLLPGYSSLETTRNRIRYAMEEASEGFALR